SASTADTSSLSLHDALPIYLQAQDQLVLEHRVQVRVDHAARIRGGAVGSDEPVAQLRTDARQLVLVVAEGAVEHVVVRVVQLGADRKSTRLNSSHVKISYAV